MQLTNELMVDDYYHLKISSKRLQSGRYQVKFFATVRSKKDLYGYALVEADETLKSVVTKIKKRLHVLDKSQEYRQLHLYHIGEALTTEPNLMIFEE